MALGEYVSVSSQRDSQRALIEKERRELADDPDAELAELAGIYEAKGLQPTTARQVAEELTAHDAAHGTPRGRARHQRGRRRRARGRPPARRRSPSRSGRCCPCSRSCCRRWRCASRSPSPPCSSRWPHRATSARIGGKPGDSARPSGSWSVERSPLPRPSDRHPARHERRGVADGRSGRESEAPMARILLVEDDVDDGRDSSPTV